MSRIRVALLGASGSIGLQAADVIAQHPDEFELVALASGRGGDQHNGFAAVREQGVGTYCGAHFDSADQTRRQGHVSGVGWAKRSVPIIPR